ncbi:putative vesicular transport factor uso1p [Histomonas meleagridis]|uniref:putative vesicular transport factor uso1p n=1 Tax=Histomonas meleagridis TaxID=135588 RepID=UPI00355A6585|nr:putative vesicular transport factor uso1p [Histomonas meleagridis]KAH0799261.1 putative vesicular transport factor uso1p [Histomonas meleagridis]
MPGLPEGIQKKVLIFKQNFFDSLKQISNQKRQLEQLITSYRNTSSTCTVHKNQIQKLQYQLDKVSQEIEDTKYNSADALQMQDKIEEKQKALNQLNRHYEETLSQKEKAKYQRKTIKQQIERAESNKVQLSQALQIQWEKHSNLTKILRDYDDKVQQLQNSNDDIQKSITSIETKAENWRLNQTNQEQQIEQRIETMRQQIAEIEIEIDKLSKESSETIENYQQQISNHNQEIEKNSDAIKDQVKEIGSLEAKIEHIVEESQEFKTNTETYKKKIDEQKQVLCNLMTELAERMALPETQTKEISILEAKNNELKSQRDNLKNLVKKSTEQVEVLIDKLSRLRIIKFDPSAQEIVIQEKLLKNSALKVKEIMSSLLKLVTCGACNEILDVPVTLVPCGHSVCYHHRYQQMEGPLCPICGERAARVFVDNTLAIVVSKIIYVRDAIDQICKSKEQIFV